VVHAAKVDIDDALNHCLQCWSCRFDELRPNLLEQVSPFLRRERPIQVLFGGSQYAEHANHQQLADQVGVDVFGPRPMYSCSRREMPSQTAASISPFVFTNRLH
jgi:hypothetical protein